VAGWKGFEKDQKRYKEIAGEVLLSYNRELLRWNPQIGEWAYDSYEKVEFTPTQATQAIPLQFGMVPEDKKESVEKSFLLTCKEHKLRTGEIGLPYILRTLGDLRQTDVVQDMIFQQQHPSYYRFVQMGETTLPEFWRDDSRSRNHDMMGAVLEYLYHYMAGISSEDGYCHIKIAPQLPTGVTFIRCCYESIMGKIEVTVTKDELIKMKVKIPVNTVGEVWIGDDKTLIQGGKFYYL